MRTRLQVRQKVHIAQEAQSVPSKTEAERVLPPQKAAQKNIRQNGDWADFKIGSAQTLQQ